jgi:hypothetical protein
MPSELKGLGVMAIDHQGSAVGSLRTLLIHASRCRRSEVWFGPGDRSGMIDVFSE